MCSRFRGQKLSTALSKIAEVLVSACLSSVGTLKIGFNIHNDVCYVLLITINNINFNRSSTSAPNLYCDKHSFIMH